MSVSSWYHPLLKSSIVPVFRVFHRRVFVAFYPSFSSCLGWAVPSHPVLTAASDCPSVCGWSAVDISNLTPSASCSAVQNFARKRGSRSDTIVDGRLCCRKIFCRNKSAVSLLVTVLYIGMKCAIFVSRSMTTMIISLLVFDLSKGPRKSIPLESHDRAGIGNNCNVPAGS